MEVTLERVKITLHAETDGCSKKMSVSWEKYIQKSTPLRVNFTRKRVIFKRFRVEFFRNACM
jgi:hypothetical protein